MKTPFLFFFLIFVLACGAAPVELLAGPAITVKLVAGPVPTPHTCPFTIKFSGSITVSEPCLVKYRFVRNDGVISPAATLNATHIGTYATQDSWTLGATYSGWEVLEVVSPVLVKSDKALFALVCAPQSPAPTIDPDFLNTKLFLDGTSPVLQVSGQHFGSSQGTRNVTLDGQPVLPKPGWSLQEWWDQQVYISIKVCDVIMWDHVYQLAMTEGGKVISNVVPFQFRYQLFTPNNQVNYLVGQTLTVKVYNLPPSQAGLSLALWGNGETFPLAVGSWTGASGCTPGQITTVLPEGAVSAGKYLALYKGWQMVSGEDCHIVVQKLLPLQIKK